MPTLEQARNWYPANDPVHGYDHVLRVYHIAERIAVAEGADLEIVRASALLHDATSDWQYSMGNQQPAIDNQQLDIKHKGVGFRSNHHLNSAGFARQVLEAEGWSEERMMAIQHCIRAHRFRDDSEQPQTLEAMVLFDADKLDAIGAIGVARAIAFAAVRGQPAYAPPSERFIQKGETEPGEPHSAYHEYLFKLVKLKDRLYTTAGRNLAEQRHNFMTGYFDRLAAETRHET
jgi:uncharacterized protein